MKIPEPLYYLDISSAADLIRSKNLSPVELAQSYLDRINLLDSKLGAYITLVADKAINDAKVAEKEILNGKYKGPIHGIPIGIKDLIDVKGIPTTCGADWKRSALATGNAPVTQNLINAGMVLLGKQSLLEFAMGGIDHNPHFGYTRNPWNLDYFSGGSSSGASASVSAGLAAGALGTDTGGSVRQPAAYCGIVGMKTTHGLVSLEGVFPMAPSLDTVGPLTRSVMDNALLLEAMTGRTNTFFAGLDQQTPKTMRIGLPVKWVEDDADSEVAKCCFAAAEALMESGVEVREIDFSPNDADHEAYQGIAYYEAFRVHKPYLNDYLSSYGKHVRERIEDGFAISELTHLNARKQATDLSARAASALSGFDALLLPTQPTTAPELNKGAIIMNGELVSMAEIRGNFTVPFNLTGWPGLSLPAGFSKNALPMSIQFVSKPYNERSLYQIGHLYQTLTSWHEMRPTFDKSN